ncbi:sensor histidine kinase [Pleurocapsales cyanobacterium LEGE 10410]|nr:sensor histidine kinase [Pleurocapsales cyanobacterium LEGE 10410]
MLLALYSIACFTEERMHRLEVVIFPIEYPLWQRQGYIAIEIAWILFAHHITMWRGWDLLLCVVLAKSCFLLRRRDTIFITVVTGVARQISIALFLPKMIELMSKNMADIVAEDISDPRRIIISEMAGSITTYLAFSTVVLLLCFLVVAEQKSRHKASVLAEEVEVLAADLERTRIARNIHDSLGHTLTTLDVQLELAQTLHERNPDRALQALNTAKSLSGQSLQEVRRAVSTMRVENFNLNTAINRAIAQINHNQFKIDVRLDLPKLPLQVSQQLYLIIKEGLVNIQKHSQANSISLWGQATAIEIILGLSDNGIGFEPQISSSGFGLKGMRERVQLLGGQMKVHSTLGKGKLIQITIPR